MENDLSCVILIFGSKKKFWLATSVPSKPEVLVFWSPPSWMTCGSICQPPSLLSFLRLKQKIRNDCDRIPDSRIDRVHATLDRTCWRGWGVRMIFNNRIKQYLESGGLDSPNDHKVTTPRWKTFGWTICNRTYCYIICFHFLTPNKFLLPAGKIGLVLLLLLLVQTWSG